MTGVVATHKKPAQVFTASRPFGRVRIHEKSHEMCIRKRGGSLRMHRKSFKALIVTKRRKLGRKLML